MKVLEKIFIGSPFLLLFIIFVLLTTIRFELLNKSFLFDVFEKHNIYAKLPTLLSSSLPNDPNLSEEERIGYSEIANNISPQVVKSIIQDNLGHIIDFINGESKDITISFSITGIGFENASGFQWSISQIPDKELQANIMKINGFGNVLIIACIIILIILVGLLFLYGKAMLLVGGIYVVAVSIVIKFILTVIGKELIQGQEPSQKILGLLSASLFSEITTTWLVMGGILIAFYFILSIYQKIRRSAGSRY